MRQQINLFQPIFRSPRKVFCATTPVQIVGSALLVLAGMYGWAYWRMHILTGEVTRLSSAQVQAQARLDELRRAYPARDSNPLLAQELLRVTNEVSRAQALAGALEQGAFGNTTGLSPYLLGFARQHVDGTWLTRIAIAEGGSEIGLEGHALKPALIPEFVQRLTSEPAFSGKSFSSLKLEQLDGAPSGIEFSITTEGAAKKREEDGRG